MLHGYVTYMRILFVNYSHHDGSATWEMRIGYDIHALICIVHGNFTVISRLDHDMARTKVRNKSFGISETSFPQ